jgi:hypothetical protein
MMMMMMMSAFMAYRRYTIVLSLYMFLNVSFATQTCRYTANFWGRATRYRKVTVTAVVSFRELDGTIQLIIITRRSLWSERSSSAMMQYSS